MKFQQWVIRSSVATVLILGCLTSVMAERPIMPSNVLPAYKNECTSCHMAYPPAMLSKPSWQRIMGSLDKHYGTDASVDAATQRQIGVWLQSMGGTYKRVEASSPADRLTTTQWFEKKHRKIEPAVWTHKPIALMFNPLSRRSAPSAMGPMRPPWQNLNWTKKNTKKKN